MSKLIFELDKQYNHKESNDLYLADPRELYNYLKNMLPEDLETIEEHKIYIELLHRLRFTNVENNKLNGENYNETMKSMFTVGEGSIYAEKQRFIYELIQNVDDCDYANMSECNLDIEFVYGSKDSKSKNPSKIILRYNETGFTPANVFAITGIAEASKNTTSNKTEIGEKGLGFKSVFGISDKVHIESGYFSF